MQNPCYKVITILLLAILFIAQLSYAASGRRKHFLSHGPSVASFGAGETLFAGFNDPAIIQYNPSLMVFFSESAASLARFNLFEGSAYNTGSLVADLGKNFFIGASVANLSSGDIEVRESIYSNPNSINVNTWNYVLSGAGFIKSLGIAYGLSLKYIYYDYYFKTAGTYSIDAGLSKVFLGPEIFNNLSKIKIGVSAQNFLSQELVLDNNPEKIPSIYRLSSAIILPVYYRFKTQDKVSLYADLKFEDDFLDIYAGLGYTIADKYSVRAGYYPEHITFGFGIEVYSFAFDYAADFSEIDLINRLAVTFRWNAFKNNDLEKEAEEALNKEILSLNEAEIKFTQAKKHISNEEYLRATDLLADIIVSYPSFESPLHFYNKIINKMNVDASEESLDFAKLTYASGYLYYYETQYKKALSQWNKFTYFTGGTDEIKEYKNKLNDAMQLEAKKKREQELDVKSNEMLKTGISHFQSSEWIKCIKKMEQLQKFVSSNNFSKTVEYYTKAKEYIDKSISELSKTIKNEKKSVSAKKIEKSEEKIEIDEESANKKYNEGLVLYAQGRYLEAERAWELTLRLNPNHQKAKVALQKMRKKAE